MRYHCPSESALGRVQTSVKDCRFMPGLQRSVAVLPLPFCHSRKPLLFPYTDAVAAAVAYLFAVYSCNRTEFSYVIFTEQQNFTTAKWQSGNRMVETRHYSWLL